MLLQRLATGATGVKQARYRRRPTRGSEALARACAVYTHNASVMYVRSCPPRVLHFSALVSTMNRRLVLCFEGSNCHCLVTIIIPKFTVIFLTFVLLIMHIAENSAICQLENLSHHIPKEILLNQDNIQLSNVIGEGDE